MAIMDTLKKWFGRAKEEAAEFSEKAAPVVDKAREASKEAYGKAKSASKEAWEKAEPHVDKAMEAGKEAVGKAVEAGREAWDKVEDRIEETRREDATGDAAADATESTDAASPAEDDTPKES